MSRARINLGILLLLATLTALTLLSVGSAYPIPQNISVHVPELLAYLFLIVYSQHYGIKLTHGQLQLTHIVGMALFLSLPRETYPLVVGTIFLGSLLGSITVILRPGWRDVSAPIPTTWLSTIIFYVARNVLSFYAASRIFLATNATLPVAPLSSNDLLSQIVIMGFFTSLYVIVYLAIFGLESYNQGYKLTSTMVDNGLVVLIMMLLPVPFVIVGAEIAGRHDSTASLGVTVISIAMITLGLHGLSKSEIKLRNQLEELRSLSVATQALGGHLHVDTLIRTSYQQIVNLLNINDFTAILYDTHSNHWKPRLVIQNAIELNAGFSDLPDSAMIDYVLQSRSALLIDDAFQQKLTELKIDQRKPVGLVSWIGVPLITGKNVIGAFIIRSYNPQHHFTSDDLRFLSIISASASIAIENAQLYTHKTQRAEQMTTLNRISTLLSGTLSPDAVLDAIISSASTITEAHAVALYMCWDNANAKLSLVRHAGFSESFTDHPPTPISSPLQMHAESVESKPAIIINDIRSHDEADYLKPLLVKENIRGWIEFPLCVANKCQGILVVAYSKPQSFSDDQLDIMRAFTNQAAQAIHNAQRFTSTDEALERRVEQLFALAAMGRILNASLDVEKIYQLILDYAMDATRAQRGAIVISSQDSPITIPVQFGYPSEENLNGTRSAMERITTRMILSGEQSSLINEFNGTEPHPALMPDTQSMLVVPIQKSDEQHGAIILEHDEPNAFTNEDRYFVMQMANQATIAINNTQLFLRIREAHDQLEVILEAMTDGIILVDQDHKIVLANPGIRLIGLASEEIINQAIDTLFSNENLQFAQKIGVASSGELKELLTSTTPKNSTRPYLVRSKAGEVYIQRDIIPIEDDNGKHAGTLLVFHNKTEEHELEQTRASISQMIVHDLRSPLTAVTTSMRLLQQLVPEDSNIKPLVTKTTEGSQRAIRKVLTRVDSLLDIAKIEHGELHLIREACSLSIIATNVINDLNSLAQDLNITLKLEIDSGVNWVDADADKIERILLNLVDNALKYSPPGSTVTIRASNMPQTASTQHSYIRVDVIDQGPGIPDDYKEKLFERFTQIEGRQVVRRGIGLGLAFCRVVADAHGGKTWIEDNPGGGSIFSFTLPCKSSSRTAKQPVEKIEKG